MSLFQCPKCERYFQLSSNHDKYISDMCATDRCFGEAVVVCSCGAKHVSGGEDYNDGYLKGIMCFGRDFKEDKDKDLLVFDAVMLEECEEDDKLSTASTWHAKHHMNHEGRTIHLRPEQPKTGMARAIEIYKELYTIGAEFNKPKTKMVMECLHEACNKISSAKMLLDRLAKS